MEETEPAAAHTACVTTHHDMPELKSVHGFVWVYGAAPSTSKGTPHTAAALHATLPVPKDSSLAMAQNTLASGTKLPKKTNNKKTTPAITGTHFLEFLPPYWTSTTQWI